MQECSKLFQEIKIGKDPNYHISLEKRINQKMSRASVEDASSTTEVCPRLWMLLCIETKESKYTAKLINKTHVYHAPRDPIKAHAICKKNTKAMLKLCQW